MEEDQDRDWPRNSLSRFNIKPELVLFQSRRCSVVFFCLVRKIGVTIQYVLESFKSKCGLRVLPQTDLCHCSTFWFYTVLQLQPLKPKY